MERGNRREKEEKLGYVEHTRGEPSLRASVYIISHHTCYISRCRGRCTNKCTQLAPIIEGGRGGGGGDECVRM